MWVSGKVFWTPKAGNSEAEYEDAYWPLNGDQMDIDLFRYAVADGATQTSFSRLWAQLLVRAYCKGNLGATKLHETLQSLQENWHKQINTKPLPWFAQEKVRQGAFATILGLTFAESDENHGLAGVWNAFAIGDSCLFQIRNNELLLRFPLQHSSEFNNSPALLSSNPLSNEHIEQEIFQCSGTWESGDLFLLMTDAIACWFLRRYEQDADPILQLTTINSQEDFLELMDTERTCVDEQGCKLMRNDDLTLFRIVVG